MPDRPAYDLSPGTHLCHVFDTAEERRRALRAFISRGIEAGSKLVCIADAPSTRRMLASQAAEPAAKAAVERGQLSVRVSEDMYLAGQRFDPDRMLARLTEDIDRGVAEGYPSVRISGDVAWWARAYPGVELLLDYERRVAGALAGGPGSAVCHYDRRRVPAWLLAEACIAHDRVASQRPPGAEPSFRVAPTGPGAFALEGELDITGCDALADALDLAVVDGADRLTIDLRALRFIDAAGATALCRPAVKGAAMLFLREPQPLVGKVLSLLGFGRLPTMKVESRGGMP